MKFNKDALAIIALGLGAVCAYFWTQDQKDFIPQHPNIQSPFGQNWTPEQHVPPLQLPPQLPPQQPKIPPKLPQEQPLPPNR